MCVCVCKHSIGPVYLLEFIQSRQRNDYSHSFRNNDFICIPSFRRNFGKVF